MPLPDFWSPVLAHNNRCLFIVAVVGPTTFTVVLIALLSQPLLLTLLLEKLCNVLELVVLLVTHDVLVWTSATEASRLL